MYEPSDKEIARIINDYLESHLPDNVEVTVYEKDSFVGETQYYNEKTILIDTDFCEAFNYIFDFLNVGEYEDEENFIENVTDDAKHGLKCYLETLEEGYEPC